MASKTLHKPAYVALILLIAFNVLLFVALGGMIRNSETATLQMMRAKEISAVASNLSKRLYDAGVALGGLTVTKSKLFSERFDKMIVSIPHDVSDLRDLIGQDSPKQFQSLLKVAELLPDTIKNMGEVRAMAEDSKTTSADKNYQRMLGTMQQNAQQIQQSLRIIAEENQELANAKIPTGLPGSATIKMLLLLGVSGNIVLGVAIVFLFSRVLRRKEQ